MTIPQMRFLVDWDNDGFFCREAVSGDALNVVDYPLTHHITVPRTYVATDTVTTITTVQEIEDFTIASTKVDTTGSPATYCGVGFAVYYSGGYQMVADDLWAVSASTQYSVTFWLKAESTFGGLLIDVRDQSGVSLGSTTISGPSNDGNWHRFSLTFNTGVGDTGVGFIIVNNGGSYPTDEPIFRVGNIMLVEGATAATRFNAGDSTNFYDDITATVEAADWSSGRSSPEDMMFSEGVLNYTLDNDDKRYSPEYASSPLYGYIIPNLRTAVEVYDPSVSDYVSLWSGWTDVTKPQIGEYRSVQASMQCKQGKFRLDTLKLDYGIKYNQRSDQIIQDLLATGWYTASNPYVFIVGKAAVGVSTWVTSVSNFYNVDTGYSTIPTVGDGWSDGDTTVSAALAEVNSIERGYLWIDRDGKINFRNRYYYVENPTVDLSLSVATQLNDAKYSYGDYIFNAIKVNYYPKQTDTNATLWVSKEPIELEKKSSKTVTARIEYEEGTKVTVESINAFDAATSPSILSAPNGAGNDKSDKVDVTYELKNGSIELTFNNHAATKLYATVTLKGTRLVSYGNLETELIDSGSLVTNGRYDFSNISSRMVDDEDTATDIGWFILTRYADAYGTFDSITIQSRDSTWLSRLIDIEIGKYLSITEPQTAATSKKVVVVGERHSWQPGILQSTYTLTPPQQSNVWVLGTSDLGTETYLGY